MWRSGIRSGVGVGGGGTRSDDGVGVGGPCGAVEFEVVMQLVLAGFEVEWYVLLLRGAK